MSKLRVIALGGGLSSLIALVEAHLNGANVDILEKSSQLGGPNRKFTVDLSNENVEFLKRAGVATSSLNSENVDSLLEQGLVAYIQAQPVKEVRVLYDHEPTSVLTDVEHRRALGIHFKRNVSSADGKSKFTEANVFGDALVYSLEKEGLNDLLSNQLSKVEDNKIIMTHGEPLGGFFIASNESTSLNDFINFARTAGKLASESHPTNLSGKGVRQPLPFLDKNGVYHGVALNPNEWIPLALENRIQLNKFNHLFRFAFPDKNQQAGLFCGQYISIRALIDGKELVRFYSPVSRNSDYGHIDLMIKIEENTTNKPMERFLAEIPPGGTVEFKGPLGGFEYHRNMYREVGMIAGGTGITPMVQIIRSAANHPEDNTNLKLLYGNYNEEDILCRDELCYYSLTRSNIDVFITLNNPPGRWAMGTGFIDEGMIRKHLPPPATDIIIVLCGPPPMIKIMISMLKNIGYTDQMIFSFV